MPSLLDLRYRIEYLALRAIVALVRMVPIELAANASARAWRFIAPYDRRHKRALENLAIAFPEKSPAEREAIALAMWDNLGRVMAETMQIDRLIAEPDRIEIVSDKVFNRYAGKMGAVIGVSLHMGNWELAIWPLTASGKNPAAIYRTVKNPYVDKYLRDTRKDLYPGGLLGKGRNREEGQTTARLIMDFVRQGGRLGIVCDLHDRTGIPVPFFGKPARSVAIPAMIARRVGARIWMARCLRVGKQSRFQIELKELKVPRTGNQAEDVKWITAEMQKQFEAWIREAPEQWMWSNRRWG
ncbi:MAG: lysophospholipid acyltransferase family protein [Hyphomicrobiaceae bacterium]|nr:MAG: lysophospholipid acyltransferase family protein [Hyphomicrobiaceae bacterium]